MRKNIAKTAQPNSLLREESALQLRGKGMKFSCGTGPDSTAAATSPITQCTQNTGCRRLKTYLPCSISTISWLPTFLMRLNQPFAKLMCHIISYWQRGRIAFVLSFIFAVCWTYRPRHACFYCLIDLLLL